MYTDRVAVDAMVLITETSDFLSYTAKMVEYRAAEAIRDITFFQYVTAKSLDK